MKTLTAKLATKKLNDLTIFSETNKYPLAKNSMAYKFAKEVIEGKKQIRPCYTSGSGRYCTNQNHTDATISVLEKIGIEFILTNDSVRGGLTGNLITITTKIKN
jgi:hypothetical protein